MGETTNKDQEHLRLLSIFHYVVGAISALFACIPIIHLIIGIVFIVAPKSMTDNAGSPPPPFFGWMFAIMGGAMILLGWTYATCLICSGRFLARRKHYLFCLIMACFSCVFIPFGTVLGVFTILVLNRPAVKEIFTPKPS